VADTAALSLLCRIVAFGDALNRKKSTTSLF
jgi:hypothetical protein